MRPALFTAVALLGTAAFAHADTIRVEPDGSGDAGTIAFAIYLAAPGDTVALAAGTHYAHDLVMKDGIRITGETGDPADVVIDAQGLGRVFYCTGIDSVASIANLTITGGRADAGGGVMIRSASYHTIENCIITGNSAAEGGGIFVFHASPRIIACEIRDNTAFSWGGGLSFWSNSHVTMTDCVITNNVAADFGGGIRIFFFCNPTFTRCTFAANTSGVDGGGILSVTCAPTFTDCVIAANAAGGRGGGIFLTESSPVLTGCTLTANTAGLAGGAIYGDDSQLEVTRTILWDDCAASGREIVLSDAASSAVFRCSDVDTTGASWMDGLGTVTWDGFNLSTDPRFCDTVTCSPDPTNVASWKLQPDSPCLAPVGGCGGNVGAHGIGACAGTHAPVLPSDALLAVHNFPDPFRGRTTITYELPHDVARARLRIYDAAGRLVRRLDPAAAQARGRHEVRWDGRDESGVSVSAGVYFYRLEAGSLSATDRMVRLTE